MILYWFRSQLKYLRHTNKPLLKTIEHFSEPSSSRTKQRCTSRPTSATTPTSTRRSTTPPTWASCSGARRTLLCPTGNISDAGHTLFLTLFLSSNRHEAADCISSNRPCVRRISTSLPAKLRRTTRKLNFACTLDICEIKLF